MLGRSVLMQIMCTQLPTSEVRVTSITHLQYTSRLGIVAFPTSRVVSSMPHGRPTSFKHTFRQSSSSQQRTTVSRHLAPSDWVGALSGRVPSVFRRYPYSPSCHRHRSDDCHSPCSCMTCRTVTGLVRSHCCSRTDRKHSLIQPHTAVSASLRDDAT